MDDIMSFLIEAEERGLLTVPLPRDPPKDTPRRGKKAAKAKREKAAR